MEWKTVVEETCVFHLRKFKYFQKIYFRGEGATRCEILTFFFDVILE